ncbi:MAG: arylsulfatase [Bacteroidetes bacterium GWE2_41_25]|nr:MAG: arylsulfatase [Bacteroidetes bacterium GWE2_41_25]
MRYRLIAIAMAGSSLCPAQSKEHPNVVIIITDDQGYGDLSFTGNPHLKTPAIDNLARQSIRLNNFYVCPVSAPTRSGLMTGRYSLRTGIRDTYNGGAIMASDEITIAEILKKEGYATGIFGKWHLGDNYPSRPVDQGFDESLIHLAGGMGQVGDITTWFRNDSSYFDPVLWSNGKREKHTGYCSDIFADEAIEFIERNHSSPFFCYLSFNAPHTPLQVPDRYYDLFRDTDPSKGFKHDGRPFPAMSEKDKEDARKVYAMVANIDENIGKLLRKLEDLKLSENTIVVFMTDNGPQQRRYVAGMRGIKGSVYNGGIRVPCFIRYPGLLKESGEVGINTAYIDIMPTIAELCHAGLPTDRIIDGKSLVPLITGKTREWQTRPLFFYWTRKYPEFYNNVALLKGNYKLAGHVAYDSDINGFELFDISKDPYEQNNIVGERADVAINLKDDLDKLFKELVNSPNLTDPPYAVLGSNHENPLFLSRNDADGERGIWDQEEVNGKWRVRFTEGDYNLKFRFVKPVKGKGQMILETRSFINQKINTIDQAVEIEMNGIHFPEMECDLVPYYLVDSKSIFPFWVEVERIK